MIGTRLDRGVWLAFFSLMQRRMVDMQNLKPMEILLVLLIVLLLFGARRLPELARGVGKSLKIFKSEVRDIRAEDESDEAPAPSAHGADGPDASIASVGVHAPAVSSEVGGTKHRPS